MPQTQPMKEQTEKQILSEVDEVAKEKQNPKILKTFKEQLRRNKFVTA